MTRIMEKAYNKRKWFKASSNIIYSITRRLEKINSIERVIDEIIRN